MPRGRRNTAATRALEEKALALVLSGASYRQAAAELGYASGGSAWKAAMRCLARRENATREQYIALTEERLHALLWPVWEDALRGSIPANEQARKIVADLRQLHGLDAPRRSEIDADISATTTDSSTDAIAAVLQIVLAATEDAPEIRYRIAQRLQALPG